MEKLSLEALGRQLLTTARQTSSGTSAKTVFGGHEHVLRQTIIAMRADASMSEHENPGEATVCVLSGRVRVVAGQLSWEGRSGDIIIMPQARHHVDALEDSTIMLTVAKLPAPTVRPAVGEQRRA
jgi:quercetin dioxygenase-like cupin family protein